MGGTWLCSNPLQMSAGRAQDALSMLWDSGPDTIRSFWALKQLIRCKDVWCNSFLEECRNGLCHVDIYLFFTACLHLYHLQINAVAMMTYYWIPFWPSTDRSGPLHSSKVVQTCKHSYTERSVQHVKRDEEIGTVF